MSKFKVRETVWVNYDDTYYKGVIWKYHDSTKKYVVMLGEDYPEEESMLFVTEDKITNSIVDVINNSPHMDGLNGHTKNPSNIDLSGSVKYES